MTSLSYLKSGINSYIGQGLNATSNPDPNTLGVVSPYDATFDSINEACAAWLAQVTGGKGKCIVPKHAGAIIPIWNRNSVITSTTTMTINLLNRVIPKWAVPADYSQLTLAHDNMGQIVAAGVEPIFLSLNITGGGTCDLMTDTSTCWVF